MVKTTAQKTSLKFNLRRCDDAEERKKEEKKEKYRGLSISNLRKILKSKRAQISRLEDSLERLTPFEMDIEENCLERNIEHVKEEMGMMSDVIHEHRLMMIYT